MLGWDICYFPNRMNLRKCLPLLFLMAFLPSLSNAQQRTYASSEITLLLQKAKCFGSVLYIAAHPDDENTRLLSWLSNEDKMRTAYLSLTRGEGGQNLIGSEQGYLLGMIRTQELLNARRIDGAEQFFSRAVDFGYTKYHQEALTKWDEQKTLSDVVWVIRRFQPDVIITRFPTSGEGQHGQHTASAMLAEMAFKAAGDKKKFPEQLQFVQTWKAKRLLWNTYKFGEVNTTNEGQFKIETGQYNPLLGQGYGEMAAESRSQHKSQGFGVPLQRGSNVEYFKLILGEPLNKSLFDNIDTTAKRVKGSDLYSLRLQEAIDSYSEKEPWTIVPKLIEAYNAIETFENPTWKQQKKKDLETLIIACSGLWFEATGNTFSASKKTDIKVTGSAINRSPLKIKLEKIDYANSARIDVKKDLKNNDLVIQEGSIRIPEFIPYTTPYWLKDQQQTDGALLSAEKQEYVPVGLAEMNWLLADFTFMIEGRKFIFTKPVAYKWTDPIHGERYRLVEVLPDVTMNFEHELLVFNDTASQKVNVRIKAWKDNYNLRLRLLGDEKWRVTPEFLSFDTVRAGEEYDKEFTIKPLSASSGTSDLRATMQWEIYKSNKSIERVDYPHIPVQTALKDAHCKLLKVDAKVKGKNIGYVKGAGDEVPQCLRRLGCHVTMLDNESIADDDLSAFDAIVIGVRAYNTDPELLNLSRPLFRYVEQGGTLISQYNTNNFLGSLNTQIGPYPFGISKNRTTDENAEVNFDLPKHDVLNTPNKISKDDFRGWVQERGLYYAEKVDKRYDQPLSMADSGESPSKGSLLITQYGKGYYVYTGLAFFRELPAGVPGAYRLFANLLSLGK